MTSLTQKQQTVLEFIRRYVAECGRAPLIREVQRGCDISSYKSVIDRLNALERKGWIDRTPNKHRGIRLQRRSQPAPSPQPNGGLPAGVPS